MNVLVTVGTTEFKGLIKYVDHLTLDNLNLELQIGPTNYEPVNKPFFIYSEHIEQKYQDADLIISHAGAGSTYRLLELGKPLILVPNLERVDQHQKDLASYMEYNHHAWVAWNFDDIPKYISIFQLGGSELKPFIKDPFKESDTLKRKILQALK